MEAIVYSKPIVFKSSAVFPCVFNNYSGTQLTWQHHHRHRRRLGFMCYHHHHNQSRENEQLKLVTIKETPATQVVYSKPIVYGKPIVFKSSAVFPCVFNNFRGSQLTWQHHHRHRRSLGFMCYHHHHQSRANEQLKLVTIKETPATQIVKPKPKRKLRLVEKLLYGGIAVSVVGYVMLGFVIMPNQIEVRRPPLESSIPFEVISSKFKHGTQGMFFSMFLATVFCGGFIGIPSCLEEIDKTEYEKRLTLKISGVILILGFVASSVAYMSISYTLDTLINTFFHWNSPLHLYMALSIVSCEICILGLIAVEPHYDKVDENEFEKGLDLKVSEAISMGADVACSPEFMSIACTMDTLSRTIFRDWHWPYNINLAVVFILLHICCRGLRAVTDLHHKHSRLPGCEKKSFNERKNHPSGRSVSSGADS